MGRIKPASLSAVLVYCVRIVQEPHMNDVWPKVIQEQITICFIQKVQGDTRGLPS